MAWKNRLIEDLARRPLGRRLLQGTPVMRRIGRQMIAGPSEDDALAAAETLWDSGFSVTLRPLFGQAASVKERAQVVAALDNAAELLGEAGMPVCLSITAADLGLDISDKTGQHNAARVADAAARAIANQAARAEADRLEAIDAGETPADVPAEHLHMLTVAIGDGRDTDAMALHGLLARRGAPAAATIQAGRAESRRMMMELIAAGAAIRLVEPPVAHHGKRPRNKSGDEDADGYEDLADLLLCTESRLNAVYPIFAVRNAPAAKTVLAAAERAGWEPRGFAFEMPMGLAPALQKRLHAAGHEVRIEVPFGPAWSGHVSRLGVA